MNKEKLKSLTPYEPHNFDINKARPSLKTTMTAIVKYNPNLQLWHNFKSFFLPVFSEYLTQKQKTRLLSVCTQWKKLFSDPLFWYKFTFNIIKSVDIHSINLWLTRMQINLTKIKVLHIEKLVYFPPTITNVLAICKPKHVEIEITRLTVKLLHHIADELISLTIIITDSTQSGYNEILSDIIFLKLQTLCIYFCKNNNICDCTCNCDCSSYFNFDHYYPQLIAPNLENLICHSRRYEPKLLSYSTIAYDKLTCLDFYSTNIDFIWNKDEHTRLCFREKKFCPRQDCYYKIPKIHEVYGSHINEVVVHHSHLSTININSLPNITKIDVLSFDMKSLTLHYNMYKLILDFVANIRTKIHIGKFQIIVRDLIICCRCIPSFLQDYKDIPDFLGLFAVYSNTIKVKPIKELVINYERGFDLSCQDIFHLIKQIDKSITISMRFEGVALVDYLDYEKIHELKIFISNTQTEYHDRKIEYYLKNEAFDDHPYEQVTTILSN